MCVYVVILVCYFFSCYSILFWKWMNSTLLLSLLLLQQFCVCVFFNKIKFIVFGKYVKILFHHWKFSHHISQCIEFVWCMMNMNIYWKSRQKTKYTKLNIYIQSHNLTNEFVIIIQVWIIFLPVVDVFFKPSNKRKKNNNRYIYSGWKKVKKKTNNQAT